MSEEGTATTEARVVRTRDELVDALAQAGQETAVVPTMGALHAGHLELMRRARELVDDDGTVVVTIFVNPLQFGPDDDLDRYPRTLEADLDACARAGADLVFAPSVEEMYPGGPPEVTVNAGALGDRLEGAARPGHFDGVLTVVAKLLNLVVPTVAVFGEKDYQQLVLVRRMAVDLELPYGIEGVPTVREPDGLALSSRNRYLSPEHRVAAVSLSQALHAGADAAIAGAGPDGVLTAARAVLEDVDPALVDVDYLALLPPELEDRVPGPGPARLLVAASAGKTRLIDNMPVDLVGTGATA